MIHGESSGPELFEAAIIGEFEGLDQVRLEPPRRPNPLHRRRAHPDPGGHRPARPMRFARRLRVQRQIHNLSDFLITDRRFTTSPLGHLAESHQPVFLEVTTPDQHGRTRHADHLTDLGIRHTIASQQQHLGPLHQTMRRTVRPNQSFQDFSLPIGYRQRRRCSTHTSQHRIL